MFLCRMQMNLDPSVLRYWAVKPNHVDTQNITPDYIPPCGNVISVSVVNYSSDLGCFTVTVFYKLLNESASVTSIVRIQTLQVKRFFTTLVSYRIWLFCFPDISLFRLVEIKHLKCLFFSLRLQSYSNFNHKLAQDNPHTLVQPFFLIVRFQLLMFYMMLLV